MTLPSFYLPPISWFSAVKKNMESTNSAFANDKLKLMLYENFVKQTCRNRCYIDSPNGRLALSIPIDKSNFSPMGKCLMKDIRISRQLDWRHQHWYAFESSYYNSPFFEYLQDDFHPIYNRDWEFLADLNEALINKCLELLEIDIEVEHSSEYEVPMLLDGAPKLQYYQVFKQKNGFLADLSIVDLLFNMGPESPLYL